MLIENDFEHDDGQRQPDAPASPPPPPLVVIQYRNRGIPLVLVPPVLILAAVLGFQAHQRMTPPRPAIAPPPGLAAEAGRPPASGATGAEEEAELFLARSESTAAPSPDLWGPLPAGPATGPAPGTSPDVTIAEEDRMPRPSEPELVDEATADTPGPADPAALAPDPSQGPGPLPPNPEHVDRATAETTKPADPPPPGPDPVPEPEPAPLPPTPEPALTKGQVLDRIRLEAEQEADRLRNLEAWKPRLLERDRKLGEEIRAVQVVQVRRLAEANRVAFHAELRKLVVALGDRAGPQINSLCEKYGRVTMPEIYNAVQVRLRRTSARLGRREKVEMMRRLGLPEPIILDAIARDASRSLKTRGGPRDMDEVRALAGRQLLAIPPAPPARATAKPVAEASMAPVPGAGRRPQ